jgi:hypothetical protein
MTVAGTSPAMTVVGVGWRRLRRRLDGRDKPGHDGGRDKPGHDGG